MNSALYDCHLLHRRFAPREHSFRNRLFFFCLDLDEIDRLAASLRLFSHHRRNLYQFRDADYLPIDDGNPSREATRPGRRLKDKVTDFLTARGCAPPHRVVLVSVPRIGGYLFNPVSFYYCFDRAGKPVCAIAEVTNTFREVKPYLLPPETSSARGFHSRLPKRFYVSPFSRTDGAFDFALGIPDRNLVCRIDEYEDGRKILHSVVVGTRRPLTDRALAGFALRYPMMGLQMMLQIHLKAWKLYRMGLPFFRKHEHPDQQRDLYRPHKSIAPNPDAPSETRH